MDANKIRGQTQALECADLSALSAGDLSPSKVGNALTFYARAAGWGFALATSRQGEKTVTGYRTP
jgi:hypothetical protein